MDNEDDDDTRPVRGRRPTLVGGTRKNVYLDTASIEAAIRLGNGDMSEGIRKALRRYETPGRAGAKQKRA